MTDLVIQLPLEDETELLLRLVALSSGVSLPEHVSALLVATAREWGAVVPEATTNSE